MSIRNMIATAVTTLILLSLPLAAAAQDAALSKSSPAVTHNSWTSGAPMPTALNWPSIGVIKGKIYVVGGYTGGPASADNQVYNPVTDAWSSAAPIPSATAQATAAVVKNVLYIFGGSSNGGGTVSNAVWAYTRRPIPGRRNRRCLLPAAARRQWRARTRSFT